MVASADKEDLTLVPQIQPGSQQPQTPSTGGETLFDIYGPVPTPEPFPFLTVGIVLLIALILFSLTYLYFKKKKEAPPPPIPPWDRALSELAEAKPMRTAENALKYMERASLILRRYIESRFAIQSTKQTTREFLHSSELENNQQLMSFRNELQTCLEQADLAKFAHRIPQDGQLLLMEDAVTAFVMKTKPAPADADSTAVTGGKS